MNKLLLGISFSLICYLNGLKEENTYLEKEPIDLEALPLEKLLEMKKELRKKVRRISTLEATNGKDVAVSSIPDAMALRRADFRVSAAGSSMQTAFQMSLTVLSFLAFGGYVISLVTQNMRKVQQPTDGTTAPQPLKTVVVNQIRRPGLLRPTGTMTTISYGRRKRSRRFA